MTIRFQYLWHIRWPIERWLKNRQELKRQKRAEARLNAAANDAWAERVLQCDRMKESETFERNRHMWAPRKPEQPNTRTLTHDEAAALFEARGRDAG